jgi:tetratricopeptide (TPR) repeat protein
MNRARIALLLTVGLAAPCLALAETALDKKPQPPQMQEDVEVMRRILNRSLKLPRYASQTVWVQGNGFGGGALGALGTPGLGVYGNQNPVGGGALGNPTGGGALGNPYGSVGNLGVWGGGQNVAVSTLDFPSVEGVYLKGHGVIYTLALPPQQNLKPDAAVSSPDKPLSEWERVRKEVRGEKVDDAAKPKKNPTVLDALLKVLAENGTHLSQLGPDETVTIVVTFRESESAKNAGMVLFDQWTTDPNSIDPNNNIPFQYNLGTDSSGDELRRLIDLTRNNRATVDTVKYAKEVVRGQTKEVPAAVKDNLLLGELSFKQGKYKEAEKAYLAALKLLESSPDDPSLGQVYHALAQIYLADGNIAEAKNYVEKALAMQKKISETPPPKKDATPPSTVPAKLIVSAPKKLLDQVGSEKISFEEFKKQVTVEYVSSPATEK